MLCVQNLCLSASFERKLLVGHPNSVKNSVVNSMQCGTNQRKQRNETIPRGFLRKCQPPAWQRFPGGISRQERKGRSVRSRRRERSRRRSRECNHAQGKEGKNSAVFQIVWRKKAMVLRRAKALCSTVRSVKRREGLGVQSLADNPNLQLSGCRAFVHDGTQALSGLSILKVVPC